MARDFGIEIEKINQKIETANSIISKIDEITSKNTEFCRKLSLISKYLRNVEINGGPYDNGEFDSVANGLLKYESSFSTLKSALSQKINELKTQRLNLINEQKRYESLLKMETIESSSNVIKDTGQMRDMFHKNIRNKIVKLE